MVVLRLNQHFPSTLRPLAEVRNQIVMALRNKQAAESARELGQRLLAELQAAPTKAATIAESAALELLPFDQLTRTDIKEPGREMIQMIFRTNRADGDTPGVSGQMLANNRFGVVLLEEVSASANEAEANQETLQRINASLQQQRGEVDFGSYLNWLRKQATIKRL